MKITAHKGRYEHCMYSIRDKEGVDCVCERERKRGVILVQNRSMEVMEFDSTKKYNILHRFILFMYISVCA